LNFQLKLKDKNLNNLTEDNDKLKNQTAGLRHRIYEIENEAIKQNSAIHAYKDQIKFYKQQCSNAENDRKENEELKKKLKFLKKYVYYTIITIIILLLLLVLEIYIQFSSFCLIL